jgi:hypothetical protein
VSFQTFFSAFLLGTLAIPKRAPGS